MFGLFLTLLLWFGDENLLVMKGGKKLVCDRYEISGDQVTIHKGRQIFRVPKSSIDWDLTKTAQKSAAKKVEKEAKAKRDRQSRATRLAKKPQGNLSLTTRDLASKTSSGKLNEAVTISLERLANNIIVKATLNGKGPFSFILDTGASMTVIDPKLLRDLDIHMNPNQIPLVGVAGKQINAASAQIDAFSIGKATVKNHPVAAYTISHLAQLSIHGLIGQDFLNHFVMELDAQANRLVLKPSGGPPATAAPPALADVGKAGQKFEQDLKRISNQLESYLTAFYRQPAKTWTLQQIRGLKQVDKDLFDLLDQAREMRRSLVQFEDHVHTDDIDAPIKKFFRCYPHLETVLTQTQRITRTLIQAFSAKTNDERVQNQIKRQGERLQSASDSLNNCN